MDAKENIQNLIEDKGFQFRSFALSKVEKMDIDGKESLVIEGLAASYDQETVLYKGKNYEWREKIQSGAFDNADMTDVIFNYNHGGRVYARTRNKSLELWTENDGLHMRATLMADDNGHQELYRDIQSGNIDKMSYAYTVEESSFEYIENSNGADVEIRTITKVEKVYDVSAVDIPAYDTTEISARSYFEAEAEKVKSERYELEERALELEKQKFKFYEVKK